MGVVLKRKTVDGFVRIRNLKHFDAEFSRDRCLKVANTYTHQQWENYPDDVAA